MSNKSKHKNVVNDIGLHCNTLVKDFFNFCDGKLDDISVITEYRDISDPMPPTLPHISKMLVRCDKVWKDYCKFMLLPKESQSLFMTRVKKQWLELEKQQPPVPKRKRGEK